MKRQYYLVIICFILFSVFCVFQSIPKEYEFQNTADEGYYFKCVNTIYENGFSYFPSLVKDYLANPSSYFNHPPSRIGYILLAVLHFKIFGPSFTTLAIFSFFCYILFILVAFSFSSKFFGRAIAYPFALLIASSPLLISIGRSALVDSAFNLFAALSVWAFIDFLMTNKKSKFFIFLIIYSFSITIRASALMLLVFFIIAFLIQKHYFKRQFSYKYLLGFVFIPLVAVSASYVILFGGLRNALDLLKALLAIVGNMESNQWAVLYCAGPWYKYIVDYMLLNHITVLLFIGYVGYILVSREKEFKILYFLLYFVIIIAMFAGMTKYTRTLRYIIHLDMVINLFAVFMLYSLFKQKDKHKEGRLVFIAIMLIFLMNCGSFVLFFKKHNMYVPINYWLLAMRRFIPPLP
ncbi:MAG: glycosyltransferase family 39 protein [Candidatus Omnitrophota bacterium]|nr:glycosyltransferase family 39 protein [Candidatus Omnitrophota bacterium]